MKPAESKPEVVSVAAPSGTLRPLLLKDADAARLFGRGKSWIRALRGADMKRVRKGEPIQGPRWCTLNRSVFYKLSDLEEWVAQQATPLGVVPFGGDHPSNRRAERERASTAGRTP